MNNLTVDLILSKAKAYVKNRIVDCSLAIDRGKIFKIGKLCCLPKAEKKIDLKNRLVLPGLIDSHVHLRDQGKSYKEDFYTGTAAAAAGGVTTVLDMPNNDPVTMSAKTLEKRMQIAKDKILVDVGFYSEFPKDISQIKEIAGKGAIAFKLYLAEKVGGLNLSDFHSMREAFNEVSKLKVPLAVHAEDKKTLNKVENRVKRRKREDIEAFLRVHSEHAEVKAVNQMLEAVKQTNAKMNFCHISTKKGLKRIIEGKKSGMPITCEVTPHHLFLSTADLRRVGSSALTVPPIRKEHHLAALWEGVDNGWVDILASDHAPHTTAEKRGKSVWEIKAGIPNLEVMLPLLLTAVKRGRLSITSIVKMLSEKPARIFGLKNKGSLEEGHQADLVVIDLDKEYKIDSSNFHSKAKYSPFDGWKVEGKPVKTFVDGKMIMNEGKIRKRKRGGKIIRRGDV